jgi:arylsulfatase A-like enzyme
MQFESWAKHIFSLATLLITLSMAVLAQTKKPNIILILADDLGVGDLGVYGQKFIKTPNLDVMAKNGMRFTNFYSSSPVCAPSRASLMTGKHQGHARIRGNENLKGERVPLRPEDTTIAEIAKTQNYRTGLVGKWGLGEEGTTGTPNKKGFDYFFGFLNQTLAHNYYPENLFRNSEIVKLEKGTYAPYLFQTEVEDFIKREQNQPFFLYYATILPHANNELNRAGGIGMEIPKNEPYQNEPWTIQQKNYAAMVSLLDEQVGRINKLLKDLKLDKNTIVMFMTDNGPQGKVEGGYEQELFQSNMRLRGLKRALYEGGIRSPLVVQWNGKIKASQQVKATWTQYDLLPTIADLMNANISYSTDGKSFKNDLIGKKSKKKDFQYWEFYEGGFVQAVRFGNWKGVRKGIKGKLELYDLETDEKETTDISVKFPDVVKKIEEIMLREHVDSEDWRVN